MKQENKTKLKDLALSAIAGAAISPVANYAGGSIEHGGLKKYHELVKEHPRKYLAAPAVRSAIGLGIGAFAIKQFTRKNKEKLARTDLLRNLKEISRDNAKSLKLRTENEVLAKK
mgnify:CR=1 FL=1